MASGADGPLERRDPVQVPAFVAEESGTRDQARTLILGGKSDAEVSYTLVRGSGGRLGDAELARAGGDSPRLDKIVAGLVAGSGADQSDQLSGYAIRYLLVRDGAPPAMSRVLDATPGLSRLSQLDGSALWRVDRQVARATIIPGTSTTASGGAADAAEPMSVAAGPVDIHTTVPAGTSGRVLRIADSVAPGWTATLDGRALTRTTVDGWAQGFELPTQGGKLDVTYDQPFTHTLWTWAQVVLVIVLLVLALPGRRKEIDDDLPEEELPVPAEPVAGEGRRARRLRAAAQAEAEAGAEDETDGAAPAGAQPLPEPAADDPYRPAEPDEEKPGMPAAEGDFAPQYGADVPQQPAYGEWDQPAYPPAGQYAGGQYAGEQYRNEQYQDGQFQGGRFPDGQYAEGRYPDAQYGNEPYQDGQQAHGGQYQDGQYQEGHQDGQYQDGQQYDPYPQQAPQEGEYDPYGYGRQPRQQPYPDETEHRPDGSNQ